MVEDGHAGVDGGHGCSAEGMNTLRCHQENEDSVRSGFGGRSLCTTLDIKKLLLLLMVRWYLLRKQRKPGVVL